MTLQFTGRVVVPVADPDDAERTASALAPLLGETATAVVVHVIEKAGGGVDKAPMAAREEYAEDVFQRARDQLSAASGSVDTGIHYGTDVVETVFDVAEETGADAVVFVPREGGRIVSWLTGDVARRLIRDAEVPVVALPESA